MTETITVKGKEYDITSICCGFSSTLSDNITIHAKPRADLLYNSLRKMLIFGESIEPYVSYRKKGYRIKQSSDGYNWCLWPNAIPTDRKYFIAIDNGDLIIYYRIK